MQETKQFIVFRDRETGKYLEGYKSKGTLAYDADFTENIKDAATTTVAAFET